MVLLQNYIKWQQKHSEIFQAIVNRELSMSMAKVQLRALYVPGDAIKIIIYTAATMHVIKADTSCMHGISGFYHLIDRQYLHALGFPNFSIY